VPIDVRVIRRRSLPTTIYNLGTRRWREGGEGRKTPQIESEADGTAVKAVRAPSPVTRTPVHTAIACPPRAAVDAY
jgi:hypothetical protein